MRPFLKAASPIKIRVDAPLILVLIDTVLSERSIGPDISNSFLFRWILTPRVPKHSIIASMSSQSGIPLNMVLPSTNEEIASCRRAIDLLLQAV